MSYTDDDLKDAGTALKILPGTAWTLQCPDCGREMHVFLPARGRAILMNELSPEEEDASDEEPEELSPFDIARDALGRPLSDAVSYLVTTKGLGAEEAEKRIRQALQAVQQEE
jgi:hypothetical protein